MKKLLVCFIVPVVLASTATAQITISEIEKKELKPQESAQSVNIAFENMGRKLFLPPFKNPDVPQNLAPRTPIFFTPSASRVNVNKAVGYVSNRYEKIYSNIYKPFHYNPLGYSISTSRLSEMIVSDADSISNRYYTIAWVLDKDDIKSLIAKWNEEWQIEKQKERDPMEFAAEPQSKDFTRWTVNNQPDQQYLFLLTDDKNGDSVYLDPSDLKWFIDVSVFEHCKNKLDNKELIFFWNANNIGLKGPYRVKDINTRETFEIKSKSKWHSEIKVTKINTYFAFSYCIYLILRNETEQSFAVPLSGGAEWGGAEWEGIKGKIFIDSENDDDYWPSSGDMDYCFLTENEFKKREDALQQRKQIETLERQKQLDATIRQKENEQKNHRLQ
jgi:hypothetical protein